ncbi:ABC transporter substrate-binding protein [Nocardioides sp. 31GB23]|uniref:Branched-chain amino acid transport system substrate-binding protein n=1 Tax=Nocardioides salarius TaxID=374513 RepID=A0ABS2M9S5_9ACTN|nr:ABC transporter substrate-binding protein [Nocardioides salarius]MBM7507902.1 branched-chain amino acid transport system substrate-binding protein [Nocardioides salarius]
MPANARPPVPGAAVHEVVLDRHGEPASARGVSLAQGPGAWQELLELARRAGRLQGAHELSFYWRDESRRLVFATVRSAGVGGRTSLSWVEDSEPPYSLTQRELEVLTLLSGGLGNAEIAERLWASVRTVTTHVERVLGKLQVRSRAAAAVTALEESLILLPVTGGPHGFDRLLHGILSDPDATRAPASSGGLSRRGDSASAPTTRRRSVRRPILLGSAFPVTGEIAEDGEEMIRASQLAIDQVNLRGGIGGRPVELVNVDLDIKDGESIRSAFSELAGRDVDALVSGYLGDQEVAHEIAAEHGAPYLHAATLESMVRLVEHNPGRYGHIFQICPSDINYGPGFVHALTELRDSGQLPRRSRSLAIVRGRWKLGDLGIERAVAMAEAAGWELDYIADDIASAEQWAEEGRRVAARAPAAVMIGSFFTHETISFVRAFQADPAPTLLYALYAPSIPRFRVEMGPAAEGLLWATTTGTYSDQVARRFIDSYRRAWAVPPGRSHAGIAYDRVRILADAWGAADSARDFGSVSEALRQGVHRGVNGAYSFAGAGQAALAYPLATPDPSISMAHLVFQIQDNRQRIVHPAPYTESGLRLPPWWPS